MNLKIFLLNGEPLERAGLVKVIFDRYYPGAVSIRTFGCEYDFMEHLKTLDNTPHVELALVVAEVSLCWCSPGPIMPPAPPEVVSGKSRRAGLRCWKAFRQQAGCKEIPWMYLTGMPQVEMEHERNSDVYTYYLNKESEAETVGNRIVSTIGPILEAHTFKM
jgi:hypothetical protein